MITYRIECGWKYLVQRLLIAIIIIAYQKYNVMSIVMIYRSDVDDITRPMRVRAGSVGKVRTDLHVLNTAEVEYDNMGQSNKLISNAKKFNNFDQKLLPVDDGQKLQWQYTKKVSNTTKKTRCIAKTFDKIKIDDVVTVLNKVLMHRGYGANDVLYNRLLEEGRPINIRVATTINWREHGVNYQLYIDSIRVKKVNVVESTMLPAGYFTERTDLSKTKRIEVEKKSNQVPYVTTRAIERLKYAPFPMVNEQTGEITMNMPYGKIDKNYTFFIDSKCINDTKVKISNSRLAFKGNMLSKLK